MASENRQTPPEGEHTNEPRHVSFVQRLHQQFGSEVDPRINLQDEGGSVAPQQDSSTSDTPSSVQSFVKRLSPKVEVGTRYEIKQEVASGGMGTILRVWDGDLRRNLAMKVMHGRGIDPGAQSGSGSSAVDPERLGRFLEEAQVTGQLDHPGVVPVHDLGIDPEGRCYFTMRFVRGSELKEVFDQFREHKEGWTRTKVLGVILKVCEAMAYAHSKGVVHRDLKPSNVMVGRFGETYVMDWGLARVLGRRDSHDLRLKPRPQDASALSLVRTVRHEESEKNPDSPLITMDGDVIGTPSYMSPEQARGRLEDVGPRSDVYSLGAILYHMLTGQAPYVKPGERLSPHTVLSRVLDAPPTPVEKLAPEEPPELTAICKKAMAREPEVRYASMLEVADDIQAYLENRVVRAYERGSLAEFRKWVARNRGMAAGIAGMVTLSIASMIVFAWQQKLQLDRLTKKDFETTQARDLAVLNEAKARENERKAKDNAELADQGRLEATHQATIATKNEERALRSGYAANILAADYSFKLNDMAEARDRLSETEAKLRGWEWRHLDLKAHGALANLGNYRGVESLAFHPSLNRAILLTGQGKIHVKDLDTLREVPPDNIQLPAAPSDTLLSFLSNLAFDVNPDGTRIALVGRDQSIQIFDLETGDRPPGVPATGLAGHAATTRAVAFSPSGRQLATGDDNGVVILWDAMTGVIQNQLVNHIGPITGLSWSPGSDRLASCSRDGTVRVWQTDTGSELLTSPLRGHRGPVNAVAWDLLGEELFSCGEDGAVNVWDVNTGRLRRALTGHEGPVLTLDYDPNEGRIVTGSSDRTVRIWDPRTGAVEILRGHESAVQDVAFSPRGDRVLSGETDGTVYVWAASGDLSTTELELHRGPVNTIAFDPGGKRLVSGSDDRELVIWDAQTGEPLRRLRGPDGHQDTINSVVFSADGRTILSGSQDKTARLWDAETGKLLKIYSGFERWINAVALTSDGSRVLIGSGDKKVYVVDAQTTEVLRSLSGYRFPVDAITLVPGGSRFGTSGKDILIWDLASAPGSDPVLNLKGRNSSLAFSPDGKFFAGGSQSGQVQVWDAETGEVTAKQEDQEGHVRSVAFGPDGRRLASASADEIRVRDGTTADTLLVLDVPEGPQALAFSPDGSRLAAGLKNGHVRIFESAPALERFTVRRAAEDLREQARALVDELFDRRFLVEPVLLEIEGNLALSRPLKEAALRLAHLRGDDPEPLLKKTLEACVDGDAANDSLDMAQRRVEAASGLKIGDDEWEMKGLMKLAQGATAYRRTRFAEAERLLVEEVRVPDGRAGLLPSRGEFGRREQALRLLFLCMAQCQTLHSQEAWRSWRQAQQSIVNDMELSQLPELLGLMAEAETLVRSSAPPAGS